MISRTSCRWTTQLNNDCSFFFVFQQVVKEKIYIYLFIVVSVWPEGITRMIRTRVIKLDFGNRAQQ